jgi:hypothetical protein
MQFKVLRLQTPRAKQSIQLRSVKHVLRVNTVLLLCNCKFYHINLLCTELDFHEMMYCFICVFFFELDFLKKKL